jgi:predicted ATPase/DNA-binding SARP family transcriptional activator
MRSVLVVVADATAGRRRARLGRRRRGRDGTGRHGRGDRERREQADAHARIGSSGRRVVAHACSNGSMVGTLATLQHRAYDPVTPWKGEETDFRVLGPLDVVEDGDRLAVTAGHQRVLLCRLLLDANRAVSRDALIEALWGERPTPTAARGLQVQVHALRRLLGAARIATEPDGYRLRVEPRDLDAYRFERALADGQERLAAGDHEAAAAALREALALWRGRPFDELAGHVAAEPEIARLEELRAVARETRIEAELALARHDDVVPELEALVRADPLRERAYGQLMLALYRAGRQADALAVYGRARSTLLEERGLEPGPELRRLQRAILAHDPALAVEPPELGARRHLPAPLTALVGRERELDEVAGLIRAGEARLVTLTGAGGVGKTRLAVQAAHGLADVFADGVHFVDLSHLREASLVASTVGHALGVEDHGDRPVAESLQRFVRERRLLLLLDNFEVVDDAAPLVGELLAHAPGLAVLATSRSPLRLAGEHQYRLAPLGLDDAVGLFTERAVAVAPRFRRPEQGAAEVAAICRQLDCLPLALELVAVRARDYSASELLGLLASPIELAAGGARNLPERHRALRATIDWSHELLDPGERRLFTRLSVFSGGCTPAAAAAVCGAERHELAALAASSLLLERAGADGGARFGMLETVREYAAQRLASDPEADAVRERHATLFTDLAEGAAASLLDDEHDNLRAALAWSRDVGAVDVELRLVAALARAWVVRGHLGEGQRRLAAALAHADGASPALVAGALAGETLLAHSLGRFEAMRLSAERALELYRSLGDEPGIAMALQRLGTAVANEGDVALGIALNSESVERFRALGDDRGLASALNNLGCGLLLQGDPAVAEPLFEESLECYRRLGREREPVPRSNLGLAALLQQRHRDALARFGEAAALAAELGSTEPEAYALEGMAAALVGLGQTASAATVLGAAAAAAERIGMQLEPLEQGIHDETELTVRAALGDDVFVTRHAAGRQLAPPDARALALADCQSAR